MTIYQLNLSSSLLQTTTDDRRRRELEKRLDITKKVHALFAKAGIDEDSMNKCWEFNRRMQMICRGNTKKMPSNPRQDNKSYVNYGNRDGRAGRIRFPKKNRKTAWKRFYKLFPSLRPKENDETQDGRD